MGPFSEQVEEGIGPSALPIQFAGARRGETSCPRFALFCNPWSALPSLQSADKAYAAPLPFFCKCAHNGFMMLPTPVWASAQPAAPHRSAREKGSRFRRSACHACCACARCPGRGIRYAAHAGTCLGIPCAVKGRVAAVDFALYPCSRGGERIQGGGL